MTINLKPLLFVGIIFSLLMAEKPRNNYSSDFLNYQTLWEDREEIDRYLQKAKESYINYKNTEFDETFEIDVIRESPDYGNSEKDNILIVVYQKSYNPITKNYFMTYVDDLESEGWGVRLVTSTNNDDHVVFRDYLIQEWNDNYIQGAFFIGNLPVAWYEMPMLNDDGDTTNWNFFPSDIYFMDVDGVWIDKERDNGIYDDHSGAVYPDIFVSRLYTSTMTYGGLTETQLIVRYLQKAHDYREGKLRLKNQAICYVQLDWAGPPNESEVFIVYDEVGYFNDGFFGASATAVDFRQRVRASTNNKYEWMYIAAHSDATYHCFKDEPFYSSEIDEIDVQVLFYLNFNCTAALYTANDCLCSWYVMQEPYGLFSIGSSKPGSMVCQAEYYHGINGGNTVGQAFLFWGLQFYEIRDWHYGLVCNGDPTLKISRFMSKPGPAFCYAITPPRDTRINTKSPNFKWTATDSVDYYKLVIEQDSTSWTSAEISDTTFQLPNNVLLKDGKYTWSVKAYSGAECIDFSQPRSFTFLDTTSTAGLKNTQTKSVPEKIKIIASYPNPFNSNTNISFYVPGTQTMSVNVYDARGYHVKTLLRNFSMSGEKTVNWNGTNDGSQNMPTGLYFCRISNGTETDIRKILYLR